MLATFLSKVVFSHFADVVKAQRQLGRAPPKRSATSRFLAHSAVTARGIAMSQALKAQRVQDLLVAMLQVYLHAWKPWADCDAACTSKPRSIDVILTVCHDVSPWQGAGATVNWHMECKRGQQRKSLQYFCPGSEIGICQYAACVPRRTIGTHWWRHCSCFLRNAVCRCCRYSWQHRGG